MSDYEEEITPENEEEVQSEFVGTNATRMSNLILQSKLTTRQRREMVKMIEELILKGIPKKDIIDKVIEKYPYEGIDYTYLTNYFNEARRNILRTISTNLEDIKNNHIGLYEKIFQFFDEADYSFGKNKALQYKERLLGLHREDNFIEINNENNVELSLDDESLYDETKLTDKERARFAYLMRKLDGSAAKYYKKKKRIKAVIDEKKLKEHKRKLKERGKKISLVRKENKKVKKQKMKDKTFTCTICKTWCEDELALKFHMRVKHS